MLNIQNSNNEVLILSNIQNKSELKKTAKQTAKKQIRNQKVKLSVKFDGILYFFNTRHRRQWCAECRVLPSMPESAKPSSRTDTRFTPNLYLIVSEILKLLL